MPNADNPLLQDYDLPPFSRVQAEHFSPALDQIIAESRVKVAEIITSQTILPTWDDLVVAMDEVHSRLEGFRYVLHRLTLTRTGETWQQALLDCGPRLRDFRVGLHQNAELFQLYQRLANSEIARNFERARTRVLEKILRQFRENLPENTGGDLNLIKVRIRKAEDTFLDLLYKANKGWSVAIDDEAQLSGLPAAFKQRMANQAGEAGLTGWLLTLDRESHRIVTHYADYRFLRKVTDMAYSTRASDQGPHPVRFDNGPVLKQLLDDRHEYAKLLGYTDFAQLAVASEQAESTEQVLAFLDTQLQSQQSTFNLEAEQLKAFARKQGLGEPEPWDYRYLAEKLRRQAAGISQEELSAWFPLEAVFSKLLVMASDLFAVNFIEREDVGTWAPDVRLFEVSEGGTPIGYIYFDLFEPANGVGFPHTTTIRDRLMTAEGRPRNPIAVLHGSLPRGTDENPTLLDHQQLRILFHEFGQCLHQVLSQAAYRDVSGINSASRDTAEFAGCLLEKWCFSKECLIRVSAHHQTGAALPDEMADHFIRLITTQVSWQTATELRNALLDFELHRTHADGRSAQQVFEQISEKVSHLPVVANARLANGLDYMAAGYAATLYADPWSNALAESVFQRFQRDGLFDAQTGKALREYIFGTGDSRPLSESIAAFLRATDQRGGGKV
ncbi:M3 family metallopeptidase [Pseudomonas sp. FP198]|uniref:M3 family metallopeptidase n=1 Tax=Pseudomonas sp. FP198 TaxID=2954084 RepID=UPI002734CFB6|nr:M3 family metallopeptidase [Pseudomonas sp. FP198]WLG95919.1 M3 family metallopeptidase [Pseudomonas sp. FP198]